ncbi:hypothetical protein ACFE04_018497 [Oxalis oulophora]
MGVDPDNEPVTRATPTFREYTISMTSRTVMAIVTIGADRVAHYALPTREGGIIGCDSATNGVVIATIVRTSGDESHSRREQLATLSYSPMACLLNLLLGGADLEEASFLDAITLVSIAIIEVAHRTLLDEAA